MKIEAHQLVGSCVEYLRCTKCSRLLETIDTVVLHSTDGANAMSSAHYLARNDTSVSAHLVVARSGRVIQLLPFNVRAWHAGVSEYEGRKQLNDFSVGIEIDNAGRASPPGQQFLFLVQPGISSGGGVHDCRKRTCCLLSWLYP